MRITILAVGKPGPLVRDAIVEYELRIRRYWQLDVAVVREHRRTRGTSVREVVQREGQLLLQQLPAGTELAALTRCGTTWNSLELATYLQELAGDGRAGVTFAIGGAYGLDEIVMERAERRLALSALTLPHDLARLILAEQLYRAGTIMRNEPYHKTANKS